MAGGIETVTIAQTTMASLEITTILLQDVQTGSPALTFNGLQMEDQDRGLKVIKVNLVSRYQQRRPVPARPRAEMAFPLDSHPLIAAMDQMGPRP